MTGLWIAIIAAGAAAALWLARPFLTKGEVELNESDATVSIYRDQFDELRRDREAGLIGDEEFDAAQQEVEARALKAARSIGHGLSVSRRSPILAAVTGGLVVLGAAGAYAVFGTPAAGDRPLAARKLETLEKQAAAGDLTSRIAILIEKTKDNPESFEDWWMLARSYSATGDHASAADAYRKAAELSDDRPAVLSAYAESLTLANGNKVPQAARLVFEQITQRTPDPRARYYLALAKAQAQDFPGALEAWTILARESKPDAPWMPLVRRDIVNMARFLKEDVTKHLPDATPQEIAKASGTQIDKGQASARIEALSASLEGDPKDYKGWIELAELRAAQGEDAKAAEAIANARRHFAAAPFVLGKLDEAARRLGTDLTGGGVAGPSDEDIAAAASMSAEDQADMIEGMVAGLAAKLDDNPDNAEGWIMLVRSYSVIGEPDKARAAYERAVAHFGSNATVIARLEAEAAPILKAR